MYPPTQSASKNLRGLVLIAIAIALANWLVSERFLEYFSPRLLWQFILAIVLLIVLAWGYQSRRSDTVIPDGDIGNGLTAFQVIGIALPFCIATLMTLSITDPKSVSLNSVMLQPAANASRAVGSEATNKDVLGWAEAIASNSDPHALDGKQADIIGAVFHDQSLSSNQVLVVRWRVSGLVFDAQPVGIIAQVGDDQNVVDGMWMRFVGHFEAHTVQGMMLPVLVVSESYLVQRPEHPYIYP